MGVRSAGCRCVAPLWSPRCYGGTWIPAFAGMTRGETGMTVNAGGLRVDQGAGIGRDAGQDSLAQPARAGRQGYGGDRKGTQAVMTRRPGRDGQGYVMTRCRRGGTQSAMPRCTRRGGKSAVLRHRWVPGTGPVVVHRTRRGGGVAHGPVRARRHSDSADPAPPPYWRGVRQHPVPLSRHSVGHAPPRAVRREVCHDPVPSAGWLCHRR